MNKQWTYTLGFRNLDGSAGKSQQTMWRFYRAKTHEVLYSSAAWNLHDHCDHHGSPGEAKY